MKLEGIRKKVFLDRYSLKDKKGKPLEKTPKEMWRRVAAGIASVEKGEKEKKYWAKKFYEAMEDFKFVPAGRILSGAGTSYKVTFYNCFVLPSPPDSRGGILQNLSQMVEIMARGGGVGINLSSLRPRGARVRKVNGFSSGPLNWAELYSTATKDIIQQGGSRRGALMLMLWDWHPDIEEFITVKKDLTRITGANLSVCVSDRFMRAVEKNEDWQLLFPDLNDKEYDQKWNGDIEEWLSLGKKVKGYKKIKARALWNLICEAAWASAEPGVVFMERYNKMSNTWYFERINCVNPCGEEGLPPYGVCNLCSINLSALVDKAGNFDFEKLKELTRMGVRFQDNIIEADSYIFPKIKEVQLGERRIGLGTMGLGDALIKMKLRYGSPASLRVIDKIYKTIRNVAYETSAELAKERGPFPQFDKKKYLEGKFIRELPKRVQKKIEKYGIRNAVLLQQAPTGSTSLLAGVSSGIEPVYEFEFIRRDRLGKHVIKHPLWERWLKKNSKLKRVEPSTQSPKGGFNPFQSSKFKKPDYFVSANDLTPEDHVKVQGIIQKYVDASISKTVNAPARHTVEDVEKLYSLAYKLGLKGITYMREGSRPGVLSREIKSQKSKVKSQNILEIPEVKPRPVMVSGATYQIQTPVGKAYITINTNGTGEPLELFINVGKAGSDLTAMAESLGRMISLSLRVASLLPPLERVKQVVSELSDIGGSRSFGFGKEKVRSLPDAIAKVLAKHFDIKNGNGAKFRANGEVEKVASQTQVQLQIPAYEVNDLCPECGATALAYEEGCKKCYSCGYSEC